MNAQLEVIAPGLLTTVQDLGRWGYQSSGVPVAGPMDPFAHRSANALAGNPRVAATLEVTLVGPAVRFCDARTFAVTGAAFELFLDDEPVPCDRPVKARPGAVLRFGARGSGARAYLAVAGGIAVPPVLGSRATHLATAMGGLNGRVLRRGDHLPLGVVQGAPPANHVMVRTPRQQDPSPVIRVLPGPQAERFASDTLAVLTSAPYDVTVNSNRMAFRLKGPALQHLSSADIISDATPVGALQVPASGQPLLLMADRQTTGGYAKLATVITADIGIAGQAAPGDVLIFRVCDRAEALTALMARERPLLALESGAT
jgi:antagonist of KipI